MKNSPDSCDLNATLNDYLREIICVCPKCSAPARITAKSDVSIPWQPYDVKLLCLRCPHRETWPSQKWKSDFINYSPSDGYEPYFGYQLYFQQNVGRNTLIVFNKKHADDLVEYLETENRPSPSISKWAMVNRLPKWTKLEKNRDLILRALYKMQIKSEQMA